MRGTAHPHNQRLTRSLFFFFVGASGTLSIIPGSASIANQVFVKFLSRLPHNRSDVMPPKIRIEERMQSALEKLAAIVEDPKVAERNPLSSISFSCLAPEVVQSQTDSLVFYRKGLDTAYVPLGPDGRPIRKYVGDEWRVYSITDFFHFLFPPPYPHSIVGFPNERTIIGSMVRRTAFPMQVRSLPGYWLPSTLDDSVPYLPQGIMCCSELETKTPFHTKNTFRCRNPIRFHRIRPQKGGCDGVYSPPVPSTS